MQTTNNDKKVNNQEIMASVIMLTYNHEDYIAQALDSILMQETDFAYEILVGDDSSTDRTLDIVEEYRKRNPGVIRVVRHERNVGASRNAYDTMKASKGKYLASCEGDDYWTDVRKLQIQVDFLEAHKEFIACTHPVIFVDKNGEELPQQRLEWVSTKSRFSLKDFKGICLPGHVVSMVRRNLFLDESFDPTIIYEAEYHIADRTQALLWLAKGDFYQIDRKMACHRTIKHGKNLTSRLYFDNTDRVLRDYKYTVALEKYANETMKVDAGFDYQKRVLFVKALVLHMMHPGTYDLSVVHSILENTDKKAWYWTGIVPVAFKRIMSKAGLSK